MRLSRRDKIARMLLIWAALAAVALVLVDCIRVVGEPRSYGAEPAGQPVEWTPCRSSNTQVSKDPRRRVMRQARYRPTTTAPDSDVAVLALDSLSGDGRRDGSLVINPGGPWRIWYRGRLGVSSRHCRAGCTERFDLAGLTPVKGRPGPAIW